MAVTLEIHPAIGIARLGQSKEPFFGPEPDGEFPPRITTDADGNLRSLRDANGALRPQAARFRVYEVERQGARLVGAREVRADEADITWRVHVVNRKAAAPRFTDGPQSRRNKNPALRRNGARDTDDLADPTNKPLIINPGKQSVTTTIPGEVILQGMFRQRTEPVVLGRIFTEPSGRLVFVGGAGVSDTFPSGGGLSHNPGDFADNDNWFDDTCDGSVEAEVKFKNSNRVETARPAWVISGPVDYAPEVHNLVTVYDILYEMAVDNQLRSIPNPVFFDRDIRPLLERVSGYQWVNTGAFRNHGRGRLQDFLAPQRLQILADPASPTGKQLRKTLLGHLREPGKDSAPDAPEMPLLHSDNFPDDASVLWLTKVQYALLQAWANNQFQTQAPPAPMPELEADALTRMALEACVGRAFWPGIEVSIRIYDRTIFFPDDPFRIANPGPIQPGILTQSMSIPWQSDFLDCAEESNRSGDILAWWPAARPNQVLTARAPTTPVPWSDGIHGGADMVQRWHMLGIVRKMANGDQLEIERQLPR